MLTSSLHSLFKVSEGHYLEKCVPSQRQTTPMNNNKNIDKPVVSQVNVSKQTKGSSKQIVVIGLFLASLLIQCSSLEAAKKYDHPCICNGTFFKSCPKPSSCKENQFKEHFLDNDDFDESTIKSSHDDSHPDHVDIPPVFRPDTNNLDLNDWSAPDTERIVRHRKIYVSEKKEGSQLMRPISITVPLTIPEDRSSLPEPKHVFKYKKYTTYENRPEIQLVPVTKTIIKPVGVSSDQIIDDHGNKMSEDAVKKM